MGKKAVRGALTLMGILIHLVAMGAVPATAVELSGSCISTNYTNLTVPDDRCTTNVKGYIGLSCPPAENATITGVTLEMRVFHGDYGELSFQLLHTVPNVWTYFSMPDSGQGWNTHTWQFSDFNGLPVNGLWRLMAWDCYPGNSGYVDYWKLTVHYGSTPVIIGGQPTSGSSCPGEIQIFQTTVEDPEGSSALDSVQYMFNQGAWMQDAVQLKYRTNLNLLYLYDEDSASWLGGYAPGTAQVIETDMARLHVEQSSAQAVGNQVTVNWAIEFREDFAQPTPYEQLVYVLNKYQISDGWDGIGTWSVVPCAPTPTATGTATETPTNAPTATATWTVAPPTATWTPRPYPGPFTPSDYIYLPLIIKNI